jgi:hypothetical protein
MVHTSASIDLVKTPDRLKTAADATMSTMPVVRTPTGIALAATGRCLLNVEIVQV